MSRRPLFISILGWFLLIYYVVSLVVVMLLTSDPEKFLQAHHWYLKLSSEMIQYKVIMLFLTPIVNIVAAVGILKCRNWSRYLFVIFNGLAYLITLIQYVHWRLILYIATFAAISLVLFSRQASEYFKRKRSRGWHDDLH